MRHFILLIFVGTVVSTLPVTGCNEAESEHTEITDAGRADISLNIDVMSAPDWAICDRDGDCQLAAGCCLFDCTGPPLADYTAVNWDRIDEFRADVCVPGTPCPGCVWEPPASYGARCDDGVCVSFEEAAEPG